MNLDMNQVVTDMLAAMKESVKTDGGKARRVTGQLLKNQEERLKLLAELRVKNKLTQEEFESRLEDHKLIMEAELNAAAVVSKAAIQNAANAAIDVFSKAVKGAISTVL